MRINTRLIAKYLGESINPEFDNSDDEQFTVQSEGIEDHHWNCPCPSCSEDIQDQEDRTNIDDFDDLEVDDGDLNNSAAGSEGPFADRSSI